MDWFASQTPEAYLVKPVYGRRFACFVFVLLVTTLVPPDVPVQMKRSVGMFRFD